MLIGILLFWVLVFAVLAVRTQFTEFLADNLAAEIDFAVENADIGCSSRNTCHA